MTSEVLILPSYDEAERLPGLLSEIRAALPTFVVALIDDGSRDATGDIARRYGVHVIRHPFNLGYGAALQSGYKWALRRGADLLVQMDADGQHLPAEVPALAERVRRGECDLAIGSRFLEPTGYSMGALRGLGRRSMQSLAHLAGLEVTDPTSGFQAMNRTALELFVSDWYPFDYPDVDVLILAHRCGLRVQEYPVRMAPGERESSLHSGWKPVYYAYKMLLSLWAGTVPPGERDPRVERGRK